MYKNFKERDINVWNKEEERKAEMAAATERKNKLQKQIDCIKAYNENIVDT